MLRLNIAHAESLRRKASGQDKLDIKWFILREFKRRLGLLTKQEVQAYEQALLNNKLGLKFEELPV